MLRERYWNFTKHRYGKSLLPLGYRGRINKLQNGIYPYIFDLKTWWCKINDKTGRTLQVNITQRPIKSRGQLFHGTFLRKRNWNVKKQGKLLLLHLKGCPKESSSCLGKTWRLLLLRIFRWKKLWIRKKVVLNGSIKRKYTSYAQHWTHEIKRTFRWWLWHLR